MSLNCLYVTVLQVIDTFYRENVLTTTGPALLILVSKGLADCGNIPGEEWTFQWMLQACHVLMLAEPHVCREIGAGGKGNEGGFWKQWRGWGGGG